MSLVFAPEAAADFETYLAFVGENRGEDVAKRERWRVLLALRHFVSLPVTGRSMRLGDDPVPVYRWPLPPFTLYYDRNGDELIVLRLYHVARRPIERADVP